MTTLAGAITEPDSGLNHGRPNTPAASERGPLFNNFPSTIDPD